MLAHVTDNQLRAVCLDALRETTQPPHGKETIEGFVHRVKRLVYPRGLPKATTTEQERVLKASELQQPDQLRIRDCLHDFFVEGLIRPGAADFADWPCFHLTAFGIAVLASPSSTPYDPDGYFAEIRRISDVDEVVVSYVEESVAALRANLIRSSVIALGVASERSFKLMMEALAKAHQDPQKAKAATGHLVNARNVREALTAFTNRYRGPLILALRQHEVGRSLADHFDTYFDTMLHNVREYRNDAGHALKVETSKRVAVAHLDMFPDYLAKVFGLISWLSRNPI